MKVTVKSSTPRETRGKMLFIHIKQRNKQPMGNTDIKY